MKSYDELKPEMEVNQKQLVDATENGHAYALKNVKPIFKEFGYNAGLLKGSLIEGRKK